MTIAEKIEKIKLICLHRNSKEIHLQFDSLLMPCGSLAAVGGAANKLGVSFVLLDETYYGMEFASFEECVIEMIEASLLSGKYPVVLASILSYNSSPTLDLLKMAKKKYGKKIRTGVAGQMVELISKPFLKKSFIDVVGVGDAEDILNRMLTSDRKHVEHQKKSVELVGRVYDYSKFYKIQERLDKAEKKVVLGVGTGRLTGIRQVTVERTRGCPWAESNKKGSCIFCSISNNEKIIQMGLTEYMKNIDSLVRNLGINWVFDVSSQWLPFKRKDCHQFLDRYLNIRDKLKLADCNKYIYLSPYIIDSEIAYKLAKTNVKCIFLGLDHVCPSILAKMNKPFINQKHFWAQMKALQDNKIKVEIGIVLGIHESKSSLNVLKVFLKRLCQEYRDSILYIGLYPVSVFYGSKLYNDCKVNTKCDRARVIMNSIEEDGAIIWSEGRYPL